MSYAPAPLRPRRARIAVWIRWELAYVGAEPVRVDTLDLFARKFAPLGFRRESFFPCYGLAEATLYVSGGRPTVRYLSAAGLREHRVVETPDTEQLQG